MCIRDATEYLELSELSGVEIASQISTAIRSYWDVQAVKREKAKAQEERRLRALAKATIKLVTAEWKKAVFVSFESVYFHCVIMYSDRSLCSTFVNKSV